MKNILLIILTIATLKVAGQNQLIGVKGGVNSTNITSSNFISQSGSRTGLTAGLTYEFLFKKHFLIGADLIYNQRGFTNDLVFTDNLGNPTGEKYTSKFNYDYISLPIKTGFNIGTKLYGITNIGVIPSLLVDAKTISPTFDTDTKFTGNETFDVTNRVSKFDFAGLVEIGGGYKFKGRYWIFTSFSYQHSFTTITNSDYFANFKIKHNGMALTIGLKCALTKHELAKASVRLNDG
jgi:hypothetical protein